MKTILCFLTCLFPFILNANNPQGVVEGNNTFAITIPSAPITLTGSVSGTMTVSNFLDDLGATGTLASGTKDIKVKATLNVGVGQAAGTYTNASDLFVTVNYN